MRAPLRALLWLLHLTACFYGTQARDWRQRLQPQRRTSHGGRVPVRFAPEEGDPAPFRSSLGVPVADSGSHWAQSAYMDMDGLPEGVDWSWLQEQEAAGQLSDEALTAHLTAAASAQLPRTLHMHPHEYIDEHDLEHMRSVYRAVHHVHGKEPGTVLPSNAVLDGTLCLAPLWAAAACLPHTL